MKNRELFYYKKLNQTIDRIKKGTVGICKECDGEINFERIMATGPTAEMCISCKEESEMAKKTIFLKESQNL